MAFVLREVLALALLLVLASGGREFSSGDNELERSGKNSLSSAEKEVANLLTSVSANVALDCVSDEESGSMASWKSFKSVCGEKLWWGDEAEDESGPEDACESFGLVVLGSALVRR